MQAASERPHPHLQYARSRIGNACDSCKARKVKCDGKAPCGYCVRRRVADTCHYSPQKRRNAHAHLPRPPPSTPGHADRARTSVSSPNREDQTQASVVEQATGSQQPPDPSNEEETDVPREARLLKDAQGKLVFIGDCAPLSFYQSVRQLVTTRVDPNAFAAQTSQHSVLENASRRTQRWYSGSFAPRIEQHTIVKYVKQYIDITAGLVDLFERNKLPDDVVIWARSGRCGDPSSIVNYLLLAIGAQDHDPDAAQSYFDYARDQALLDLSGDSGLSTVQAFVLITLYMLRSCQINGAFLFFGFAVRAAFSIGVHRTEINARFGSESGRQRDRLWISLRILDLYLSASMGRPPATSDVDCTVAYYAIDGSGGEITDLLNASIQIMLISEAVIVEVYSRRKISLAVTEGISGQLKGWSSRWLQQLKNLLDLNQGTQHDNATIAGACQVLASYYYSVILVARPFLVYELCRRLSGDSPAKQHDNALHPTGRSKLADACIDAAIMMVDTTTSLIAADVLPQRMPFLVSWLFASSLVIGLGALGGFGRILEKYASHSIDALEHFAKNDAHAMQYSLIAKSLLKAAVRHLEEKETPERLHRTASSGKLFGLVPEGPMNPAFLSTPIARPEESLRTEQRHGHQPVQPSGGAVSLEGHVTNDAADNNGTTNDFFQTWSEMPDFSMFDGLLEGGNDYGNEDWSALNLFPLLEDGGHIDLAHHF